MLWIFMILYAHHFALIDIVKLERVNWGGLGISLLGELQRELDEQQFQTPGT